MRLGCRWPWLGVMNALSIGCADYVGPSRVCADAGDAIVSLPRRTVDLSSDPMNCGCVGVRCPTNPHGTEACRDGICVPVCARLWGNCNNDATDGCEYPVTEPGNCGACGAVCNLPHASAGCSDGTCVVTGCVDGYVDCNHSPEDGCETDITDVENCGACGNRCDLPNAVSACIERVCRVGRCLSGYADCDPSPTNGCEVNVVTDARNCGYCGHVCSSNGGLARCVLSRCMPTCNMGRANCEHLTEDVDNNGCETDLRFSYQHCGTCSNACSPTRLDHTVEAYCMNSRCASLSCQAGWGDCNSNPADGCEGSLNSTSNCGRCGRDCGVLLQHVTGATCSGGACNYGACVMGYSDCDGNRENGCEAMRTTC